MKITVSVLILSKQKLWYFAKKNGRLSADKFYYDNIEIENSTSYKCLGIIFSSFSYCQTALYKRAVKAQFKLTKCFLGVDFSRSTNSLIFFLEFIF